MSIARSKKTANYTTISNALIADKSLSWRAKGIAIYLLSKPDDWQIVREDIEQYATDGIASVRAGLKELEDAGYLTRTRKIGAHGHFEWDIVLHETPPPSAVNQPVEQPPSADLPPVVNPSVVNPPAENRTLLNTDVLKTDLPMTDNQKSEGVDDLAPSTPSPALALAQADVDEFVNATNLPAHAPSPTSGAPPSRIVLDDPPTGPPQARQFDPRQLDAGGLWPEGTGQTPYEVYREAFATIPSRYQIRHMNANVTDLVKWRAVTQKCAMKDFKSYDNVFDVYQNGFRQEKKAYDNRKQPTTRPEPAHARPDLYEQFGWNATTPAPA